MLILMVAPYLLLVLLHIPVAWSATLGLLDKPRYELETHGRRAFSYAGPSAWNSLPAHLRSQNVTIINNFRHSLKTFLFSQMIHAAH